MGACNPRLAAHPRGWGGHLLAIVISLVLTLGLVTSAGASTPPTLFASLPVLRLNYYNTTIPVTLDPAFVGPAAGFWQASIIQLTNANLVRLLPTERTAADLATWRISRDGLTYTFTIRRNARFSNGHDVTANDAAFSIRRAIVLNGPLGFALTVIKGEDAFAHGKAKTVSGVRVLGKKTLQLILKQPTAYFLAQIANGPVLDVVDPTVVGSPTAHRGFKPDYLTDACVANQGAGPFKFVCRTRRLNPHSFYSGSTPTYTLVPNPYYYGRKPHIRIELAPSPGGLAEYKHYLQGKIDTSNIPGAVYNSRWKGSSQYREYPTSSISDLIPNTVAPPFNNAHCRLAVAYAINRPELNTILHGTSHPLYDVVPIGLPGHYSGKDNPHYSLTRARAELARCPSRTTPIELKYSNYPDSINEFSAVGRMLSAAGLNVRLTPLSGNDWFQTITRPLTASNTQLIQSGWEQDFPDPYDYCNFLLESRSSANVGLWHSARYDQLVDRAAVISNQRERVKLYVEAQHLALSQGAIISLTNDFRSSLVKPYIHGVVGSEASLLLVPQKGEWANVSISKH